MLFPTTLFITTSRIGPITKKFIFQYLVGLQVQQQMQSVLQSDTSRCKCC